MTEPLQSSKKESLYLSAMEGQKALLASFFDARRDLDFVHEKLKSLQLEATVIQVASSNEKDRQIQIAKKVAKIQINLQQLQTDLKGLEMLQSEATTPQTKVEHQATQATQDAVSAIQECLCKRSSSLTRNPRRQRKTVFRCISLPLLSCTGRVDDLQKSMHVG
jgi:hypothetical protein